jgi:hypothetical protein
MKSLVDKLYEALDIVQAIDEAKIKDVETTVGEYLSWWFGREDFDHIDPYEDFETTDFDPESLEKYFDNNMAKQYEFLKDHKDEKIKVSQRLTSQDDYEVEFKIGKYTFKPVCMNMYIK